MDSGWESMTKIEKTFFIILSCFRSRLVFVKKLNQIHLIRSEIFFLLKILLYGFQKIRNFMEIPKSWLLLSDKMHLKGVFSKKTAILQKRQSPKICCFLEITLFRSILSLSYDHIFGISIKLRIF